MRLDGSTPEKERQLLVDQFNTRPSLFLFLISTTAGGLGLNLVGANKVVSRGRGRVEAGGGLHEFGGKG